MLRDLSWRERVIVLALVGPLILALTLIWMDRIYEYLRDDHACGLTCRAEVHRVTEIFEHHHDEATSCLAEFQECVRLSQDPP